ncbi:hypothetical protein H0E87_014985 [Populus deltoides]|uniref:Mediator of RNA polymerase II transcription subunit 10 n=1 Tax=Populus deltoides TaxID=3696 RepID=A0A8T2Y382_POPDE|nr:hypothetical protein H0E87_014985 [Populus deltoides]
MLVAVKAMKNPRSALCKTSIMASSDIFKVFGDQLLDSTINAFDNLLLQLLLKASQDKRFVCEEADRALNAMVKSVTPLPLLNKLRPYVSHSNPRVRAKAAITISKSVSKMGLEGMNEFGLVSLRSLSLLKTQKQQRSLTNFNSLIDDGKNPDEFTRGVINSCITKNEVTKEKTDAFKSLRKHLVEELEQTFPDEVESYREIRAVSAAVSYIYDIFIALCFFMMNSEII